MTTTNVYSAAVTNVHFLKHGQSKVFPLAFLSFWLGCLCIGISYLLLIWIEREEYALRTLSIGSLALLVFSFHLLVRNTLRDPFHPDILLTVGHLVQFVIPSVIFATGLFDEVLYPHTRQVRTFFPEMLFAILLAQTVFNLPFCLKQTQKKNIIKETKKKWPLFIVLLATVVWACRFFIVFTGSYFHGGSSDFMNISTLYSPLAIFNSLGTIVTAYVALRIFGAGGSRKIMFPRIYVVFEIAWHLFSGKREGLIIALLCIVLSYIFVRRKISARYLLVFFFVLFVGVPFLQHFRESMRKQSIYGEISVKVGVKEALEKQKQSNSKKTLNIMLDRLNDGQFAAGCFQSVPNSVPFVRGRTYKYICWIPIPRMLYPARPQFVVNYNSEVRPWATWFSAPVTAVGEAYLNFGWLAIPVVFFLLGLVYRFMDSIFKSQLSYTEAAILIFFCSLVIRLTVNPAVVHLSWMAKIIILLLACRILSKVHFKGIFLQREVGKRIVES